MEHCWVLLESEISPCTSQQRLGRKAVPDILSSLHCFCLYTIVTCCNHLEKAEHLWEYQAITITEVRWCAGQSWLLDYTLFCQQITSLESTDFSKINQYLYSTMLLPYSNRRQHCPGCILPNQSLEECTLYTQANPLQQIGWPGYSTNGMEDTTRPGEYEKGEHAMPKMTYTCPHEHVCSRCLDHTSALFRSSSWVVDNKAEDKGHWASQRALLTSCY